MSYTSTIKHLIAHYEAKARCFEAAYLKYELERHLLTLSLDKSNNPYLAAYYTYNQTTSLSGDETEQFGTVFANTLMRWHCTPNIQSAMQTGYEKWDLVENDRARYFHRTEILLLSSLITAAIVEFTYAFGNCDSVAEERLSILGVIYQRLFNTPEKDQIINLSNSILSFNEKVSTDKQYQDLLSAILYQFVKNGEEDMNFLIFIEDAMRRAVPLTLLIAPTF